MVIRVRRAVYWTGSILLAIVLLAGILGLGYIATTPTPTAPPYTELYVLGPDEQATEYPDTLAVDEPGEVIVGITNREHTPQTYTLILQLAGEQVYHDTVRLQDGSTWEAPIEFTPTRPGDHELAVVLYQGHNPAAGAEEPYRSLKIQLTVTDA